MEVRRTPIVPTDLEDIFRGLSHPEVVRYYGVRFDTLEATREQMAWYESLEREGTGRWWALRTQDEVFCGAIGLNNRAGDDIEIGFWLLPEYQRKGLIAKHLPEVLKDAKEEFGLRTVTAWVEEENTSSAKVVERAGFECVLVQPNAEIKDGRPITLWKYQYTLTATNES